MEKETNGNNIMCLKKMFPSSVPHLLSLHVEYLDPLEEDESVFSSIKQRPCTEKTARV